MRWPDCSFDIDDDDARCTELRVREETTIFRRTLRHAPSTEDSVTLYTRGLLHWYKPRVDATGAVITAKLP